MMDNKKLIICTIVASLMTIIAGVAAAILSMSHSPYQYYTTAVAVVFALVTLACITRQSRTQQSQSTHHNNASKKTKKNTKAK